MLYLLDANVLIDANRDYYPMDRVPEFWDWLLDQAEKGSIRVPHEIFVEPKSGKDALANWLKRGQEGEALLMKDEPDIDFVRRVVDKGYAADLTDEDQIKLGRDPFLIAHALVSPTQRCVVTTEVSRPSAQRANKKVPDVCAKFGIQTRNTFQLIRDLNFSTSWKK